MKHSVVHIVDDAAWGGVNRLLAGLEESRGTTRDRHQILRVPRGTRVAPAIEADVIVSHMAVCWKNLPFFTSLRASHPATPLVHVEHSYSERFVALKVQDRQRFNDLMRLTYALFDRIVAVSGPQAEWLSRRRACQPDQLVTIPSCVDLRPFRAIAGRRPTGPFTIGAIGRFHEQKGFDILVEAFVKADLPDTRLLLVGDGPEKPWLQVKAAAHPGVIFVDSTPEPAQVMALCHAVAMPSRWEPYGLVALEAMAAERPVFCSMADGLRQHIRNGAMEVHENSVEGWVQFLRLHAHGGTRASAAGSYAAAHAEHAFTEAWNWLVQTLLVNVPATQMAA
ncbi:MAG: glycosyltransferase family 4 protein [Hyphomicrobiales bacterium]